jgi:hypothetical protein
MSHGLVACGFLRASFAAGLASLALAGCAGGGATALPSRDASVDLTTPLSQAQSAPRGALSAPRFNASGCGKSIVYAASYDNSIHIYDRMHNGKVPCGSVIGLNNPQGLFVDKQRNLWVVNGGPKQVLEFAPNNPTPIKTLQDSSGFPIDVAVDNNSGTVYVTNFFQNGSKPGVVEVYANGSTTPTATLSDPNMTYAFYDAVDDQGNLYVTYLHVTSPTGIGQVDEWIGGTGTPVNLGITLQAPGGIQTTSSGALLICDQAAPACGDFPAGTTTMTNLFATKDQDPFAVALDQREHHAFVEDPSAGVLERWSYPGPDAKQNQRILVPGGAYAGVAVSPPARQGLPW